MGNYIETAYTNLEDFALGLWPEIETEVNGVTPSGVWRKERIEQVPWTELIPPFAVVEIANLRQTGEYGACNRLYECEARLTYVYAIEADATELTPKLEAARDDLLANDPEHVQIIDVDALDWSDENAMNQTFLAKGASHRGVELTAHCLIGEWAT